MNKELALDIAYRVIFHLSIDQDYLEPKEKNTVGLNQHGKLLYQTILDTLNDKL